MTSAIVLAHVVSIERDHCGHALLRLSTGGVRHAGLTPEQAATELAARLGRRDPGAMGINQLEPGIPEERQS